MKRRGEERREEGKRRRREEQEEEKRRRKKRKERETKGRKRPSSGGLGSIFDCLGCLGGSWAPLGRSWAVLRPSLVVRIILDSTRSAKHPTWDPIWSFKGEPKWNQNRTQDKQKSKIKTMMNKTHFEDRLGAVLGRFWVVLAVVLASFLSIVIGKRKVS